MVYPPLRGASGRGLANVLFHGVSPRSRCATGLPQSPQQASPLVLAPPDSTPRGFARWCRAAQVPTLGRRWWHGSGGRGGTSGWTSHGSPRSVPGPPPLPPCPTAGVELETLPLLSPGAPCVGPSTERALPGAGCQLPPDRSSEGAQRGPRPVPGHGPGQVLVAL